MIDIEICKNLFCEYVKTYDMNNPKIFLKEKHTFRVMEFCEKIAKSLNLSDDDIKLSMLIGLLHDIGRFEQVKVYDTFSDLDSIDHADYGVEILKKDNFIEQFVSDKKIQELVLIAVKNHNKYSIEDGLDDRTMMFCKIIRDADKLDIFNIFINEDLRIEKTGSCISEETYNQLINMHLLSEKYIKTKIDYYLKHIGMFFDLNYEYSFNYVIENKLNEKIIDNIIKNHEHEREKLTNIKNKLCEFYKNND